MGLKALLVTGLFIDVFSCYLGLRRNRRGFGPSGISMITPIVFYFLPLMYTKTAVFAATYWIDCLIFLFVHIALVYGIPWLHGLAGTTSKRGE